MECISICGSLTDTLLFHGAFGRGRTLLGSVSLQATPTGVYTSSCCISTTTIITVARDSASMSMQRSCLIYQEIAANYSRLINVNVLQTAWMKLRRWRGLKWWILMLRLCYVEEEHRRNYSKLAAPPFSLSLSFFLSFSLSLSVCLPACLCSCLYVCLFLSLWRVPAGRRGKQAAVWRGRAQSHSREEQPTVGTDMVPRARSPTALHWAHQRRIPRQLSYLVWERDVGAFQL